MEQFPPIAFGQRNESEPPASEKQDDDHKYQYRADATSASAVQN